MKRKLIIAALMSLLTANVSFGGGPEVIVEPDYFSGFFVGPTGAFHMTAFQGSSTVSSVNGVFANGSVVIPPFPPIDFSQLVLPAGNILSTNVDGSGFSGYYGVQGGVGKVFNHKWYIGFVGFGEWGSQTSTSNTNSNFQQNLIISSGRFVAVPYTVSGNYTSSTQVKISNDFGAAFKPGFLVAPKSMVYGKIGAVWADIKVSNSFSGTNSGQVNSVIPGLAQITSSGSFSGGSSDEDRKIALLLGIGFEQFIYMDLASFFVEYNYANYGHVTTTGTVNGKGTIGLIPVTYTPFTTSASADAKVGVLLGGLNIHFGSHWF